MSKRTMGTKLPRKLAQYMQVVGEQIKLARLRRNLTVAQVADRATCSTLTVSRIEKGVPTVSIGIYLRVLYALQLETDLCPPARDRHPPSRPRRRTRSATPGHRPCQSATRLKKRIDYAQTAGICRLWPHISASRAERSRSLPTVGSWHKRFDQENAR